MQKEYCERMLRTKGESLDLGEGLELAKGFKAGKGSRHRVKDLYYRMRDIMTTIEQRLKMNIKRQDLSSKKAGWISEQELLKLKK